MAILYAVIFARNILELSIPVFMILGIASLIALDNRRDEIIALCICCIPLSAAFQYKYLLLICILVYIIKYKNDIRVSKKTLLLFLMLFWELLHGFRYSFSIYECLRSFSELIFCTFLMTLDRKKTDYVMICRLLAISSVFMFSIVLLNLLKDNNFNYLLIFRGSYRFGIGNTEVRNFGVNYNANQLGFICNLSVSGLMQLILSKNHRKVDYLLSAVLILFGIMTMSRTFLVCLALLFIMFVCLGNAKNSVKIRRLFTAVLTLLLIGLFAYLIMPVVFNSFIVRFMEDDISNGRTELFLFYHEHLLSGIRHLFFGLGIQNFTRELVGIYGSLANVCHNGIQEILVCWGIPGLFMMTAFLLAMIFHRKWEFKREKLNYIPLILLLVDIQAGQFLRSGVALLALSFVYLSLRWNSADSTEEPANESHT